MVDSLGLVGGGESLARAITERLDSDRFEAILCTTRATDPDERHEAAAALSKLGVALWPLERTGRIGPGALLRLRRRLRDRGVDVVHAHKFGSNLWAALFAHGAAGAVIAHEHGARASYADDRGRQFVDREVIGRRSDIVVAVSHAEQSGSWTSPAFRRGRSA